MLRTILGIITTVLPDLLDIFIPEAREELNKLVDGTETSVDNTLKRAGHRILGGGN